MKGDDEDSDDEEEDDDSDKCDCYCEQNEWKQMTIDSLLVFNHITKNNLSIFIMTEIGLQIVLLQNLKAISPLASVNICH